MSELKEVVYCKDCIYRPRHMNSFGDVCPPIVNDKVDGTCPEFSHGSWLSATMPEDNFFCAYGKEKSDD